MRVMEKRCHRTRERKRLPKDSEEECNSENYVLKKPKHVFGNHLASSVKTVRK